MCNLFWLMQYYVPKCKDTKEKSVTVIICDPEHLKMLNSVLYSTVQKGHKQKQNKLMETTLTEKDLKCKKDDFDQLAACKAPVCWSKYTKELVLKMNFKCTKFGKMSTRFLKIRLSALEVNL